MVIRISEKSWLRRLYDFNFHLNTYDSSPPTETNLCQFVRVLVVWLPLKLLFYAAILTPISVLIFYLFFVVIPDSSMWLHWFVWSMIALLFVTIYAVDNYFEKIEKWTCKFEGKFRLPDPARLAVAYVKAKKKKICPMIEFYED